MRVQGDAAYALFDTGPEGQPHLYGVNYERRDGRWSEGISGNGPGWSHVGPEVARGTLTIWSEAPLGADKVRLEFEGELREEPVDNGVYLAAWWDVPCPKGTEPRISASRVNGQWVRAFGGY